MDGNLKRDGLVNPGGPTDDFLRIACSAAFSGSAWSANFALEAVYSCAQ